VIFVRKCDDMIYTIYSDSTTCIRGTGHSSRACLEFCFIRSTCINESTEQKPSQWQMISDSASTEQPGERQSRRLGSLAKRHSKVLPMDRW